LVFILVGGSFFAAYLPPFLSIALPTFFAFYAYASMDQAYFVKISVLLAFSLR